LKPTTFASRIALALAALTLAACTLPQATPVAGAPASSSPSPFAPGGALTATPSPTPQPTATETQAARTPAPEPGSFESEVLRPGIEPVSYIGDQCEYLQKRWDPAGSLPGTVVASIMYHSVLQGNAVPQLSQDINANTFDAIVEVARDLGFETITTEQLLHFLHDNAKIPPRSMILILDDRRPGTAEEYFLPLYEEYGWTTTLAWIIGDSDQRQGEVAGETIWDWIERLNDTGAFDVQSHGLNHIPIVEGLDADFVREELSANIPILREHFGQRPIAHIWAGGNYSALGVTIAEEAGYELGFTIHSRGPVQFNWIPQGAEEQAASDNPLLLLPRFWDTAATLNLEQTAAIGDAAQGFARENYAAEAAWFSQNCSGELPPLDEIFK
jgi:hypothetical protein